MDNEPYIVGFERIPPGQGGLVGQSIGRVHYSKEERERIKKESEAFFKKIGVLKESDSIDDYLVYPEEDEGE